VIKALKLNVSISIILLCTVLLSGIILISSSTSATSASTSLATVKVAASCTLTTTGGGNYSAIVPNGTSAEIAGSTMSVSCNDAGGFALYAVGYSDDTIGNNNMIGSSTNIPTNTSGTNSYWAMKINPTSGTTPTIENSFNNYHIVPDIHTKVASYASSTGTGSLSVYATYKANISSTQLAGNYLGKVKYTLVHPANEIPQQEIACDPGKICYNANTNIVEGQMGKQTPTSSQITNGVTLYAPNFKRDGYGFAGWNTEYDYSGNFYGPNQTITTPSDVSTNGLSLYAVWIKSAGSLQNWDGCGSLAQGATTALTDERDGNTYAVAKLADNKCWMIENLRLADKDNRNNNVNLSSANTHNPSLPFINYNGIADKTQSNHLSQPYDPYTLAWCSEHSSDCYDQSMLATNNTTLYINNTSSNYSASNYVYSYGNYYNWYSATAGHGTYNKSSGNTAGDICPTGWHLPTGRSSGDFGLLDIALGGPGSGTSSSTTPTGSTMSGLWRSFPNNFTYSGSVMGSFIGSRNGGADYWTSSANGNDNAINLIIINGNVSPGTAGNYKYQGKSVRCVHGI
jgi:uncharacterized protein (TIGR02145 family)